MYKGEFKSVHHLIKRLSEIADIYEYNQCRIHSQSFEAQLLYQCRRLYDAEKAAEIADSYADSNGSDMNRLVNHGVRARIQLLSENLDGAKESLIQAKEIIRKHASIPIAFISSYCIAKFSFDIRSLEESVLPNKRSSTQEYKKNAYNSGKNAIRNAKRAAIIGPETFRLMGLYYWIIFKQDKAVKWWKRAIEESERLGARPDLARTYMEIGKRFLEKKSKYKELNGISAEGYLEKAKTMFQEMDLQWDLDELDKIAAAA
jgi:hypothetical protein